MENIFSQIKKKVAEKTMVNLDRSMPQPNPIDNTIKEVASYNEQAISHNKTQIDQQPQPEKLRDAA